MLARLSAEASVSAGLDAAWRWLIECQRTPLRLNADDLPALGQDSMLRLTIPITAPRAVLCALWLFEDADTGSCLLAGHLRFVAHPKGSQIRLNFNGRVTATSGGGLHPSDADTAARQLLELIGESIQRPTTLARPA
jgi:hypothetical protein